MCLLAFKKPDASVPAENMIEAAFSNPNGAGIAVPGRNGVAIHKSPKWRGKDVNHALSSFAEGKPALIHFRYATHGKVSHGNAHPFQLPYGWAVAHNGIIGGVMSDKAYKKLEIVGDESDTLAFIRQYIVPILNTDPDLSEASLNQIERLHGAGNKMVFLHQSGRWGITNEQLGHWEDGVWYSNFSYEPYKAPSRSIIIPKGGGFYNDAWSDDDFDAAYERYMSEPDPVKMDDEKPRRERREILSQHRSTRIECEWCGFVGIDDFAVTNYGEIICDHCATYIDADDAPAAPDFGACL
jgi:predicted glutamine amidotransferase